MTGMLKKTSLIFLILLIFLLGMSSIHAQDNATNNDTLCVDEAPIKTYTDLFNKINSTESSTIELNESYEYNSKLDNVSFVDGVSISKNITLVGLNNNTFIDGNHHARLLYISPNCNIILKNIIFINGYSKTHGGAINVGENSTVIIDNCTFHSNKVYNCDGGAINGQKGTDIYIYNSLFYNNTAVRVSNLPWKEFKSGMGSAICMRIGTNLRLKNTTFRENVGSLTTILIITWDDVNTEQSTLCVNDCLFEGNVAKTNGVIYLDEFGIAKIENSIFRNNVNTYYGGTVAFDTSKSAVVKNCTFEGNSAVRGGAIYINSYNKNYRSHVKIIDTEFTDNYATEEGGAIFSKYGITCIVNSNFTDNVASKEGGAVYSKIGSINIDDCKFNQNSAQYGGALLLKTDSNAVTDSSFVKNKALICGGAIYSTEEKISSSGCIYSKNSAPKASKVYGAFYAKVTKYVSLGVVKLKVVLSSPWNMPVSQKIKIKIKGYTSKWLKTNSKGVLTFSVPKNKAVSKNTLSIVMDQGVCFIKSYVYKNQGKISVKKLINKSSKVKVTIKNSHTKKPIKKTSFIVKIYAGKKIKKYTFKTNSKGVFKISTNLFRNGTNKLLIYLNNDNYHIYQRLSIKVLK